MFSTLLPEFRQTPVSLAVNLAFVHHGRLLSGQQGIKPGKMDSTHWCGGNRQEPRI